MKEDTARYVCNGLQEAGHTVTLVGDGVNGLHLCMNEHWDVIILDRMLPGGGMDGYPLVLPVDIPGTLNPTVDNSLTLNDTQLKGVDVEEVKERLFDITRATVGNIDFNRDNSLQVFTPYPGRITKLAARAKPR
jgi:hypothetical protein